MKYYDIVFYKLLENNNIKNLEKIFLEYNIGKLYVLKKVSKKKDIENFNLPKSKIDLEKVYLVENNNLISYLKNKKAVIFGKGENLKDVYSSLNNKSIDVLYNPISDKLCFDEGCCNLCKSNKIKIAFNLNLFKIKQYRSIKQSSFIFPLLIKHKIDMLFGSFAEKKKEIIDPRISIYFLKNFAFEKEILNRFFDEKICLRKE